MDRPIKLKIKTLIFIICFFAIASILWYFSNTTKTYPAPKIALPEDELLDIEFEGFFHNTTTHLSSKEQNLKLFIKGSLEASPKVFFKGIAYKCRLNSWQLLDDKKRLLLGFEKKDDGDLIFYQDKTLSPEIKQKVFDNFHIDNEQSLSSLDNSLLRSSFTFFLTPQGVIKEFKLSKDLKNSLHEWFSSFYGGDFWKELITFPDKVPPLFPETFHTPSTPNLWKTQGILPESFIHKKKVKENNHWEVSTTTMHPYIDWKINWSFNPEQSSLNELDLEIDYQTRKGAFTPTQSKQKLKLSLKFNWKLKLYPLTRVPLF
jgi:hypothetical protein